MEFGNVIELIREKIDSLKDAYHSTIIVDKQKGYAEMILECRRAIKKLNDNN